MLPEGYHDKKFNQSALFSWFCRIWNAEFEKEIGFTGNTLSKTLKIVATNPKNGNRFDKDLPKK